MMLAGLLEIAFPVCEEGSADNVAGDPNPGI